MLSKSNLISTLATAVWGFFGGWILWGILVDPLLADHNSAVGIMKEMPDMFHLVVGCLITGFIFSTIYSKYSQGNHGFVSGLNYGCWIGLLIGLGEGMVNMSVMNMLDFTGTLINAVTYVVFYAIMGGIAGMVYQKTSAAA
jgi:hypothetical protein